MSEGVDAKTIDEGKTPGALPCERIVCVGCGMCGFGAVEGFAEKGSRIKETIDAVTGATWNARNHIMERLFQNDLESGVDGLPTYVPPGEQGGLR